MTDNLITLQTYLEKNQSFQIPNYQRGYVWGKSRGSEKDSVSYMMESIQNCFLNETDLFLQGITVCEHDGLIELIDGQQRTTFLYLLLTFLEYPNKIHLKYPIRTESQKFLDSIACKSSNYILSLCQENVNEEFQDIFYFKKTIRIINGFVKNDEKRELLNFILKRIKFLYIPIPKEKAVVVFSMMNGNKAKMKYEEIIKAEMLRLVSNGINIACKELDEAESLRWEQNLLRSKYAREWDKWLYWWNRDDVKAFYHTDNVMGLLIETYYYSKEKNRRGKFNYENFRDCFLRGDNNELSAKKTFYQLRNLQKRFEDSFNNISLHNQLGIILTILNKDNRKQFIRYYFTEHNDIKIEDYLKYVLLFVSHTVIIDKLNGNENESIQDALSNLEKAISDKFLYTNKEYYELCSAQLLRLNMEQDTKLGRFFDFNIWNNRSLEHIYPKSKVYHKDETNGNLLDGNENILIPTNIDDTYLNRDDFYENETEHCIGNLVLLYKDNNSKFGNSSFDRKKSIYFDLNENFSSRHLLHTISVFAESKWGIKEIHENKKETINKIKEYYGIQ
jgi:hypothetical protein